MQIYTDFYEMNSPKTNTKLWKAYEASQGQKLHEFSATTASRENPFPQSLCGLVLYLYVSNPLNPLRLSLNDELLKIVYKYIYFSHIKYMLLYTKYVNKHIR